MPFIRVKSLKIPETNLNEPILHIDSKIEKETGYDASLIRKHLGSEEGFEGFGLKSYMQKGFQKFRSRVENWFLRQ